MRAVLVLVGTAVTGAGALIWVTLGDMARAEAQTRLRSIPRGLIRLALGRVPEDLRDDLAAEWSTELDVVLTGTQHLPLTALWRGITYSAGLLRTSGQIAAGLKGTPARNPALSPHRLALGLAFSMIGVVGIPGMITEYLHHQITVLRFSAAMLMALSWALGGALAASGKILATAAVATSLACAANVGFYLYKPGAYHLVSAIIFFLASAGIAVWKAEGYHENRVWRLAWRYHDEMFPDCSDCASPDKMTAGMNAYQHIVRVTALQF